MTNLANITSNKSSSITLTNKMEGHFGNYLQSMIAKKSELEIKDNIKSTTHAK